MLTSLIHGECDAESIGFTVTSDRVSRFGRVRPQSVIRKTILWKSHRQRKGLFDQRGCGLLIKVPRQRTLSGVTPRYSGNGNTDMSPTVAIFIHLALPARKVSGCFTWAEDEKALPRSEVLWFSCPRLSHIQEFNVITQKSVGRYFPRHPLGSVREMRADDERPFTTHTHSDKTLTKSRDAVTASEVNPDLRFRIKEDLFALMEVYPQPQSYRLA